MRNTLIVFAILLLVLLLLSSFGGSIRSSEAFYQVSNTALPTYNEGYVDTPPVPSTKQCPPGCVAETQSNTMGGGIASPPVSQPNTMGGGGSMTSTTVQQDGGSPQQVMTSTMPSTMPSTTMPSTMPSTMPPPTSAMGGPSQIPEPFSQDTDDFKEEFAPF